MKYILNYCLWTLAFLAFVSGSRQIVNSFASCPASHLQEILQNDRVPTSELRCNTSTKVEQRSHVDFKKPKRSNISSSCAKQLDHLVKHYSTFKEQSHNIINDLQARLSRLRDVWPSSFQECLNVRDSSLSGSRDSKIRGQYCLTYFLPPTQDQMTQDELVLLRNEKHPSRFPFAIPQTGLCLPNSCSTADVQEYLKSLLEESADNFTIVVHNEDCQTDKPKPFPLFTKIVVAFIVVILIMALLGTILEVSEFRKTSKAALNAPMAAEKNESLAPEVFKCFSLFSNCWFLFKMDTQIPGEVEAFNGTKFISVLACELIHVIIVSVHNAWSNLNEAHFIHEIANNGGFFYLQLFLQTVVAMRIGVPYFILIAFVIGIVPYLGSGPKWPDVLRTVETCKERWWANVLFINNYYSYPICLFHSWYLSADIQLLLLSPILILAFNRSARMGFACSGLFIGFSVAKLFYHAYFDGLNSWNVTISHDIFTTKKYLQELYVLPYSRIGCYSMGIIFGYFGYFYGKEFPFSKTYHRWFAAAACLFTMSPFWLWYRCNNIWLPTPTHLEVSVTEALSRILFTSSTGYICLSVYTGCQDGVTKFFRRILCQKLYVLTSKLNYSVFLLHILIIEVYFGTRPQPMEYSTFQLFKVVLGLVVLNHVLAIPFTVLAVFPVIRLDRVLEQRWKTKKVDKEIKQKSKTKKLNGEIKQKSKTKKLNGEIKQKSKTKKLNKEIKQS